MARRATRKAVLALEVHSRRPYGHAPEAAVGCSAAAVRWRPSLGDDHRVFSLEHRKPCMCHPLAVGTVGEAALALYYRKIGGLPGVQHAPVPDEMPASERKVEGPHQAELHRSRGFVSCIGRTILYWFIISRKNEPCNYCNAPLVWSPRLLPFSSDVSTHER